MVRFTVVIFYKKKWETYSFESKENWKVKSAFDEESLVIIHNVCKENETIWTKAKWE